MAKTIEYTSPNGYTCTMYGLEVTIRDAEGSVRFHTFSAAFRSEKDMRQFTDEFPEFLELMKGVKDDGIQ